MTDPPAVDVGIFWDYENVRIPKGFKASSVANKVRVALAKHGQIKEQNLYYDSRKVSEERTDRESFDMSGWTLVDCPTRNVKETLDKKLIVDVMHFAYARSSDRERCVVLITSDGDYAYTLNKIRNFNNVKTIVMFGETAAGILLESTQIAMNFSHEVLGTPEQQVPAVVLPEPTPERPTTKKRKNPPDDTFAARKHLQKKAYVPVPTSYYDFPPRRKAPRPSRGIETAWIFLDDGMVMFTRSVAPRPCYLPVGQYC